MQHLNPKLRDKVTKLSRSVKSRQSINRFGAYLPLPLIYVYRSSWKNVAEAEVPQWPTTLWWTIVSAPPEETLTMCRMPRARPILFRVLEARLECDVSGADLKNSFRW